MINFKKFFRATSPNKSINVKVPEQRQMYVDFTSVRGGETIRKIRNEVNLSEDDWKSILFTGHIGCGKTTELLRLKEQLEQDDWYVIYLESDEYLEVADVDIVDVLLVIASCIINNLEAAGIQFQPQGMQKLLQDVWGIFNAEITGGSLNMETPLGKLGVKSEGDKFSISLAFAEITAKAKVDSRLREQMNRYLAPKKTELIAGINDELLKPAIAALQKNGKEGLVVIVDNLDRIDNTMKPWGKSQQEYLFADQGQFLTQLHCHLVYTMPLSLMYSVAYNLAIQRFGTEAKVLPMVQVQERDGNICERGIAKMKEMVFKRACPDCREEDYASLIPEIFESEGVLTEVCRYSGGHVRDLLRLLNAWIMEEGQLPLSQGTLQKVVVTMRNNMGRGISQHEAEILKQVQQGSAKVSDDEGYQVLIRSRYVFEYIDEKGSWYVINPILEEILT
jgi:hypothetical protein